MDISVKSFENRVFTVKAEPTTTIEELKKIILAANPINNTELFLSYKGRILEEDQTVSEANIKGGDENMVLMARRFRCEFPMQPECGNNKQAKSCFCK